MPTPKKTAAAPKKTAAPAAAPAATAKKPAGWLDDLKGFAETARETVFKPKTGLFRFGTSGKSHGQGLAVVVNAKIKADADTRKVLVRIPADLDARLKEKISGPQTVALVALAEWALEQLDERREILTIENK